MSESAGPIDEAHVRATADAIAAARAARTTLPAPFAGRPLTPSDADAVQDLRTRARLDAGERIAGWKLGYTSAAMRAQMGVDRPNLGPLTDAMLLRSGADRPGTAVLPATAVQPRVEPEVAVVLSTDLAGVVSREQVAEAVASARAALEVVDSVWTDYRFALEDNTADGSSAAYVVIGDDVIGTDPQHLDAVAASLQRNGETVGEGSGADAMGHPLDAVAWLAARLGERGLRLRAGDVVITGGLTRAVPVGIGDTLTARVGDARVSLHRPDPGAGAVRL